jgi:hypothetical protein
MADPAKAEAEARAADAAREEFFQALRDSAVNRTMVALAAPPAATRPAKVRGGKTKLPEATLDKHLEDAPLDKLNPDGTPFSAAQRVRMLKKDGIEISANRLSRRLKERRERRS